MICFLNLAEAVPKGIPSCAGLRWLTAVLTLNARRRKEELDSQVLSPHRFLSERGKWDSNPRVSDHLWFSRPAHSSALPYPRPHIIRRPGSAAVRTELLGQTFRVVAGGVYDRRAGEPRRGRVLLADSAVEDDDLLARAYLAAVAQLGDGG